ncbi:MarR family winged helix-turn-helix transcriptional regulator [Nocardia sp. NPDC051833]|uniref:MarR family winged helix-turn-helix transcriptional regulator n=1 Tax=Nocardia sp. NPDC051833 TaxID=3155674 RepID=UPI003435FDEF
MRETNPVARITQAPLFLLFRVGDAAREAVEQALERYDLRGKDFRVLAYAATGTHSQQDLARSTGLDRTTMVAVVDRLERTGMATRERGADRRRHVVVPTAQGLRTLTDAFADLERTQSDFLAALSPATQQAMDTALTQLFTAHDPSCRPRPDA